MKLTGKAKAAFLRRMAKGRNKKHGTHKRKRKHHSGGHHVAKRRHHSSKHKTRSAKRRRGSGGLGSMGRWIPDQHKLVGMGAAFAYGKVEAAASKDANHIMNKVPNIIGKIGRSGNLGALLWVGAVVTRHPIVKAVASGVLHVAAYQNGRNTGGFSKDAPEFKLSGYPRQMGHAPGRGRDELLVERWMQGQRGGS